MKSNVKPIKKILFKMIKVVVIIILILLLLITFIMALQKILMNKTVKNDELIEVYNNMKNLKNVTITREYTSLVGKRTYVYSYDVDRNWGSGDLTVIGYDDLVNNTNDSSSTKSYYFVRDNNRYYYYYDDMWDVWASASFLDDYDYILKFLVNPNTVVKNSDGSYTITIKDSLFNEYQKYYKIAYNEDPLFPKTTFVPGILYSYEVTIDIKVNDDKYITDISLDKMPKASGSYSISYSDFNDSKVDIPIGVLATLYDNK